MAKNKEEKTNVMRVLEQKKLAYTPHSYPHEEGVAVDGVTVAKSMGFDPAQVFKTLVARGASGQYYVFDVPVAESLDLKKAAKAVGEKSIEMLHQKELLPLTGYVHGGCSPVGMKKLFPTVFHSSVENLPTVSEQSVGRRHEMLMGSALAGGHETGFRSVENLPTVIVSAGKIGYQVEVKPADLMGLVRAETADIIVE